MILDATISDCGLYRYDLLRCWGDGPGAMWVMLNPSTADANLDDATIRKCIGFTTRLGLSALTVVNLFAFRARHPKDMKAAADPIGPQNDEHIVRHAFDAKTVICAWGPHGALHDRDHAVVKLLREIGRKLHCLHVTADGSPGHPLMLSYDRPLLEFGGTT